MNTESKAKLLWEILDWASSRGYGYTVACKADEPYEFKIKNPYDFGVSFVLEVDVNGWAFVLKDRHGKEAKMGDFIDYVVQNRFD